MMTKDAPKDFKKEIDVVGCFVQHESKFLLLHRNIQKTNGGKWGCPAGKVDPGETISQAMKREIEEETGLHIEKSELRYFETYYVRNAGHDFLYHMFSTDFSGLPEVTINPPEHQDFRWVTPDEALMLDYIHDLDECIKVFYCVEKP
jgi:8-oxo-dGTP diphosphatase